MDDVRRGSRALLLAGDDHAAIPAVADKAGAFRGCDEDAAVDASGAVVRRAWRVSGAGYA
jgi:hypothetical protein